MYGTVQGANRAENVTRPAVLNVPAANRGGFARTLCQVQDSVHGNESAGSPSFLVACSWWPRRHTASERPILEIELLPRSRHHAAVALDPAAGHQRHRARVPPPIDRSSPAAAGAQPRVLQEGGRVRGRPPAAGGRQDRRPRRREGHRGQEPAAEVPHAAAQVRRGPAADVPVHPGRAGGGAGGASQGRHGPDQGDQGAVGSRHVAAADRAVPAQVRQRADVPDEGRDGAERLPAVGRRAAERDH
ncbi:hypothetical protein ON010_g5430 [Phytophthora cinnamomi]|nr:hypothetical protein ON010_g5430 [Phytophthora cinnamomi]